MHGGDASSRGHGGDASSRGIKRAHGGLYELTGGK